MDLPQHLIYWPSTVTSLVSGSLLLVSGSIADVIGSRVVNQTGNLLLGCFALARGSTKTGQELIAVRALGGCGLALYLPSSLGSLTRRLQMAEVVTSALRALAWLKLWDSLLVSFLEVFSYRLLAGG